MDVLESHVAERLRLSSCLVNDVCLNSGDLSAPTIRASAATSIFGSSSAAGALVWDASSPSSLDRLVPGVSSCESQFPDVTR